MRMNLISLVIPFVLMDLSLKSRAQTCLKEKSCKLYPKSCAEVSKKSDVFGIKLIQLDTLGVAPFYVFCKGKGVVIQRRMSAKIEFMREYNFYKYGFGDLLENFWMGLDKIFAITNDEDYELHIRLKNQEGYEEYANYDFFVIGTEDEGYAVKILGKFNGTINDSFSYAKGMKFSTSDRQHVPFTNKNSGGWWYSLGDKTKSQLNDPYDTRQFFWKSFAGEQHSNHLTYSEMKLVPKKK